MQYLLTEDEFRNMVPAKHLVETQQLVIDLREWAMAHVVGGLCFHVPPEVRDLDATSRVREIPYRYCDECPLGKLGSRARELAVCNRTKRYSK